MQNYTAGIPKGAVIKTRGSLSCEWLWSPKQILMVQLQSMDAFLRCEWKKWNPLWFLEHVDVIKKEGLMAGARWKKASAAFRRELDRMLLLPGPLKSEENGK